jgi:outer membrane protein insertion porin family
MLGFGGEFNRELIEADAGQLRDYYKQFGYHDVQITYEVQILPDGRHAALVFHIREGARYRLHDTPTIVASLRTPRKEELEQVLQLKPHEWYDGRKIKRGEEEIRDWYGYQGYDVRVQAVPYFSKEQPGFVLVRYEVDDRNPQIK